MALVTGAGSGIGHAIAHRFGLEGASVAVNYFGWEEQAEELARELSQDAARSIALKADVSDPSQVGEMVEKIVAEFGRIDVLVNNAGVEKASPFLEIAEEDWDRVIAIDLKGAFLCMQACGKVMREKGGGSIVNISSIHEDFPFPGFTAYCAAKGGMRMLMRNAALELAPFAIRVNNVAPGAIETPINQGTLADPEKMATLREIIPLGRMGRVDEVAQVVTFLASSRASYVTGSTYYVDGGMVRFAQAL